MAGRTITDSVLWMNGKILILCFFLFGYFCDATPFPVVGSLRRVDQATYIQSDASALAFIASVDVDYDDDDIFLGFQDIETPDIVPLISKFFAVGLCLYYKLPFTAEGFVRAKSGCDPPLRTKDLLFVHFENFIHSSSRIFWLLVSSVCLGVIKFALPYFQRAAAFFSRNVQKVIGVCYVFIAGEPLRPSFSKLVDPGTFHALSEYLSHENN